MNQMIIRSADRAKKRDARVKELQDQGMSYPEAYRKMDSESRGRL